MKLLDLYAPDEEWLSSTVWMLDEAQGEMPFFVYGIVGHTDRPGVVAKVGYTSDLWGRTALHKAQFESYGLEKLMYFIVFGVGDIELAKSAERFIQDRLRIWRANKQTIEWFLAWRSKFDAIQFVHNLIFSFMCLSELYEYKDVPYLLGPKFEGVLPKMKYGIETYGIHAMG